MCTCVQVFQGRESKEPGQRQDRQVCATLTPQKLEQPDAGYPQNKPEAKLNSQRWVWEMRTKAGCLGTPEGMVQQQTLSRPGSGTGMPWVGG